MKPPKAFWVLVPLASSIALELLWVHMSNLDVGMLRWDVGNVKYSSRRACAGPLSLPLVQATTGVQRAGAA